MLFSLGDSIEIKQWKEMEYEYGVVHKFCETQIDTPRHKVKEKMKIYCGKRGVIEKVVTSLFDSQHEYYLLNVDGHAFKWTAEMLKERK